MHRKQVAFINEEIGFGMAQVTKNGALKECNGAFIPDKNDHTFSVAFENAKFTGVVYEDGMPSLLTFPIKIIDSQTDRIEFVATT